MKAERNIGAIEGIMIALYILKMRHHQLELL